MIILALDSALTSCSAAVIRDGGILSEIFEERTRGQAERLIPMCQEACRNADVSFDGLDVIAVTRGPGTFTGVRIGLAAARGLALALNSPLVGVTTLDVVARNVIEAGLVKNMTRFAVALDARRSEVYLQLFDVINGDAVAVSEPAECPLENIADCLDRKVAMVLGSGAELVKSYLPAEMAGELNFPDFPSQPNAATVGLVALTSLDSGDVFDGGGFNKVSPLYLRPPDAVAAKPISYPFQNQ